MKKKAIEAIPYMELPHLIKGPAEFVGRTAIRTIKEEEHIILEVYKNKRGHQKVPVVRYVATKKDWGIYWPEDAQWTRQSICGNVYLYGPVWNTERYGGGKERKEKNVLLDPEEDQKRIKAFCKEKAYHDYRQWWDDLAENERKIGMFRKQRIRDRRQERLEERKAATPPLDNEELLSWAKDRLFHKKHFLYYKKRGSRAEVCCSACGGVDEGKWRRREHFSLEESLRPLLQEPVSHQSGTCRLCGARGTYMPQGKVRWKFGEAKRVFLANKYKEKGAVIRYVELEHEWNLELVAREKGGLEMHGAYEAYSGVEIARAYICPGKPVQIDYQKHDRWTGEDFWDDCNLYGVSNIQIAEGRVYPKAYEELQGTCLQYSGLKEYEAAAGKVNAIDYLQRYVHFQQIEMLAKMGYTKTVTAMVKGYCGIIRKVDAKRPEDFLGIRKERLKDLQAMEGDTDILAIMQQEKTLEANWSMLQIQELADLDRRDWIDALRFMTLEQLLNRTEKYAGVKYVKGGTCSEALARLRQTLTQYVDYLKMRSNMGYDMQNQIYVHPRDLDKAHKKMVDEQNKRAGDKRIEEVKERFAEIRKRYRKLRNKYYYEDDTYIIRPARSAEEIVLEGRLLHHCVGGDTYLGKHARGESCILVMRTKEKPEIPYITVEIKENRILQWYGAYDKKPDEKNMSAWLDAYLNRLKGKSQGELILVAG